MRVGVVGCGAVGGYFGARMIEGGCDVSFIVRGATLETLRSRGLRLESPLGNLHLESVGASESAAALAPLDLVLMAVKAGELEAAAREVEPAVRRDGLVLPLQNGVEAPGILADVLGKRRVLGGLCRILSTRVSPAEIRHEGYAPTILFGSLFGTAPDRLVGVSAILERAPGVTGVLSGDILAAMWEKCLFVTALGSVAAAIGRPAGVFREIPECRAILAGAMGEILAVAQASGVALDGGAIERALEAVDSLPRGSTASMQRDLAEGRPSELEFQIGAMVRRGAALGVPTPINATLHACLLPTERDSRLCLA